MFRQRVSKQEAVHPVEQMLPPGPSTALAIQHLLAAYASLVVTPMVIAGALGWSSSELVFMISACLVTSGICTIIQCLGIGVARNHIGIRLPVVQGTTVVAIPALIMIGSSYGFNAMFGATIAAGAFTFLIAGYWSQLLRFFPPVVTGTLITVLGVSLLPIAAMWMGGGKGPGAQEVAMDDFVLAAFSMILVATIMMWGKGALPRVAILIGLIAGSILAFLMGKISFDGIASAEWFGIVTPFALGLPEFKLAAIISMLLAMLVTMIESTGGYIAIGEVCEKQVEPENIAAGLRAEGLGTMLGGIMCSFPYTTYSQNTGVLRVSGVRSRWVVALCGVFLIFLGIFPKLSALAACVPLPVLGGASMVLFGSIACTGLKILGQVDMDNKSNLLIVSISLGLAMLSITNPIFFNFLLGSLQMLLNNPITLAGVSALLLNYLFNMFRQSANHGAPLVADL